jgi:AraC-like DNA-binding protein
MHARSSIVMDVLTDLLRRSRARGAAFAQTVGRGRWGVSFAPLAGLAVHSVIAGEVLLVPDDPADGDVDPIRLGPGDMVLVQGRWPHSIRSSHDAAPQPLEAVLAAGPEPGRARSFRVGEPQGAGPDHVYFCGAYLFDGDVGATLIDALPRVVHLRPAPHDTLHAALALLAREVVRDEPGQQTLLDRLLDVVLVQSVRTHFHAQGDQAPGWFRASTHPEIGVALRAVHDDPARPWTVAELAALATMSRSAFARRFADLVGEPPLAYVTALRMSVARELLRDTDETLASIASTVGYSSEFAFAATFKRHTGVAPGRWRRSASAACDPVAQ